MLIYTRRPPLAPRPTSLVFAFALSFSRPRAFILFSRDITHGILSLPYSLSLSPVSWWSSRAKTVTTRRLLRSARGRSLARAFSRFAASTERVFFCPPTDRQDRVCRLLFSHRSSIRVQFGGYPSRSFEIDAGGGDESASAPVYFFVFFFFLLLRSLFSYLRSP